MVTWSDWNPDHYLEFGNERTQPSIDLVNRIDKAFIPHHILDVGCGPGNSSRILSLRWPSAHVVGIDNSPAMIEKANKDFPEQEWLLADAACFTSDVKFDLIFSNATIQWIPQHEQLFQKWMEQLSASGVVAIQLPKFQEIALGRIIYAVAGNDRWKNMTEGCLQLFTYHDVPFYYDLLAERMKTVVMWETDYIHVMETHQSIVDWTKSTGMKPFLDRIDDEHDKRTFEREVLDGVMRQYPARRDGKVLFPFKRLFIIGYQR